MAHDQKVGNSGSYMYGGTEPNDEAALKAAGLERLSLIHFGQHAEDVTDEETGERLHFPCVGATGSDPSIDFAHPIVRVFGASDFVLACWRRSISADIDCSPRRFFR